MRFPSLLALTALAQIVSTSCTPLPGPADPFSGGRSPAREGVQTYTVRLEVVCDGCRVQYFVGPRQHQDNAEGSLNERLGLTPLAPTVIRLRATPSDNGGGVRLVRISVDGEVVAEDGCANCDRTVEALGQSGRTRAVETVIPPRTP